MIRERLLRLLCRDPGQGRYPRPVPAIDGALDFVCGQFPGFRDEIKGKTVLDFGCGEGFQALALARFGAKRVVGVDLDERHLARAAEMAREQGLSDCVRFMPSRAQEDPGVFDVALSLNAMEHYAQPATVLRSLLSRLAPGGRLYISFGPPWYSPFGAHTRFFCRFPWIHLLFPERVVMRVRSAFTDDRATRYEESRGGLNRMSLARFECLMLESGARILRRRYTFAMGCDVLERVPFLRELLIYQVSVVLEQD